MIHARRVHLWHLDALRLPPPPPVARIVGRGVGLGLLLILLALVFVPWQQTVSGAGRVVAYSPTEREQHLHAPVGGRILRWDVVEGSRVTAGDPIVQIVDVDPNYVSRLELRRDAEQDRVAAAAARSAGYSNQAEAYERARGLKVAAARMKVKMAEQKLIAARQKARAAEAAAETTRLNLERTRQLTDRGLASQRQLELAELSATKAEADLNLSRAGVTEAEAGRTALDAEALQADAEGGATIAKARAEAQKADADQAYARGDLAKVESELARQDSRVVRAPVSGTIVHIDGNQGGGIVKTGQHLAVLVPDTRSRAVEVFMDGNDAPLVSTGRKVRLQFEGWPAVQFAGWPSVAMGTFGGTVAFVDPAATDAQGRVRVLIRPDQHDQPWPDAKILRQQVRAKAWVMLDQVSLGWEVWRNINGFPPALDKPGEVGGQTVAQGPGKAGDAESSK